MNILTPDKISDIKSDVKASDFQSLKEFAEGLDQAIVSAQRDLTASIKDDEFEQAENVYGEVFVKSYKASMGELHRAEIAQCKAECQARIEALKQEIARRLDKELDSGENVATICRNVHFLMKELFSGIFKEGE